MTVPLILAGLALVVLVVLLVCGALGVPGFEGPYVIYRRPEELAPEVDAPSARRALPGPGPAALPSVEGAVEAVVEHDQAPTTVRVQSTRADRPLPEIEAA